MISVVSPASSTFKFHGDYNSLHSQQFSPFIYANVYCLLWKLNLIGDWTYYRWKNLMVQEPGFKAGVLGYKVFAIRKMKLIMVSESGGDTVDLFPSSCQVMFPPTPLGLAPVTSCVKRYIPLDRTTLTLLHASLMCQTNLSENLDVSLFSLPSFRECQIYIAVCKSLFTLSFNLHRHFPHKSLAWFTLYWCVAFGWQTATRSKVMSWENFHAAGPCHSTPWSILLYTQYNFWSIKPQFCCEPMQRLSWVEMITL